MSEEKLFTKEDMLQFRKDIDGGTEFYNKYSDTMTRPQMIEKWFEEFELKDPPHGIVNKTFEKIMNIYNSNMDWDKKYDLIFSDECSVKIREHLYIDYYDPDMDYEDDVRAYVNALIPAIEEYNEKQKYL